MKRRRVLAVVGAASMGALSGCSGVADLLGDDEMGESETRLLTKYESGYGHFEGGTEELWNGIDAYERDDYAAAESAFSDAEQPFDRAADDFSSIETETITEIGSENLAGMIGSASGMASVLVGRADRLSEAAAVLDGQHPGTFSEESYHDLIQGTCQELRNGELDVPTPEEIESEF